MGKKKSKTKTEPWKPLQPQILGAANTVSNVVNSNQGNLESIAGEVQSHLPQISSMAFGAQPGLAAAQNYATDVLGGKYLGQGNPYTDAMIGKTANDVGNRVNSTFSMAGRTGGMNHVQGLTEGLANAENALRYQDYSNERGAMSQAAGMLPSLTQAQYAGVMPYLAASQAAGALPYAGVSNLSPLLGLAGGSGTTTQNNGGLLGGILGAGLSGWASGGFKGI